MIEWMTEGVTLPDSMPEPDTYGVCWLPEGREADDGVPVVVSVYGTRRDVHGRYRVMSETTYRIGAWVHVEKGPGSGETYSTKREAQTWARRMAEMEAVNRTAVAWDGQPA